MGSWSGGRGRAAHRAAHREPRAFAHDPWSQVRFRVGVTLSWGNPRALYSQGPVSLMVRVKGQSPVGP